MAQEQPSKIALSASFTRSQSGRALTNTIDGGTANTFGYDPAGRLVTANVGGRSLSYDFGDATGCPVANAGRNTNRRAVTDNGATTTYCYDAADRLVSSSDPAVGNPAYDAHGNTTTLGTQTLAYDGADRHVATTDGPTSVTYVRDATDRIVERKVAGNTVARYGYAGPGDGPAFVNHGLLLAAQQRTFSLVGGVLYAKGGPSGDRWSYPNIHGDVMAVADANGAKVGATATYDPFGRSLTALPDNEAGNFDYGWLGQHQRPLEHEGSLATIEMGARPYVPSLGRFLAVDPVEGGCANDYTYVFGDPINTLDVTGLGVCENRVIRFLRNFGSLAQWFTDPGNQLAQETGKVVLEEQARKLDEWRAKRISRRVVPVFSQSVAKASTLATAVGTFIDLACMKTRQNEKYRKYFDSAHPKGTYSSGGVSPYINEAGVPNASNGY